MIESPDGEPNERASEGLRQVALGVEGDDIVSVESRASGVCHEKDEPVNGDLRLDDHLQSEDRYHRPPAAEHDALGIRGSQQLNVLQQQDPELPRIPGRTCRLDRYGYKICVVRHSPDVFGSLDVFVALSKMTLSNPRQHRVIAPNGALSGFATLLAPDETPTLVDNWKTLPEMSQEDRDSNLVIPPWDNHSRNHQALPLKHWANPFTTIVPANWLGYRFPRILSHLGRPELVVTADIAIPFTERTDPELTYMSAHSIRVALVKIVPDATASTSQICRFFQIPDLKEDNESSLISDFTRLLQMKGGSTKYGFIDRDGWSSGQSLRPEDHDPKIKKAESDQSIFGSNGSICDVFTVLRSRHVFSRDADDSHQIHVRVVSGRDLTRDGELLLEDSDNETWRGCPKIEPVPLMANDLVMREMERKNQPCMPAIVTLEDLPAAAGPGIVVLRPLTALSREELHFYRTYLGSSTFRYLLRANSLRGTVRMDRIRTAPLPKPDAPILGALQDIWEAQQKLVGWADDAVQITAGTFAKDAGKARTEILESGRTLRQRSEAASLVETLDYRVSTFYPYPISHKWRIVRATESSGRLRETYAAILDCYETSMAFIASVGLAYCSMKNIDIPAMKQIRNKLGHTPRGVTLGDWINIAKELTTRVPHDEDPESPLTKLSGFLVQGTDAELAQVRLSARRNDEDHQRQVDEIDLPGAIESAIADLKLLLEHLGFLSDVKILSIAEIHWDSILQAGALTAEVLRGDNPVPTFETFDCHDPGLERGSLYANDSVHGLTLLRPFLVRSQCPKCGTWSTFHPDSRNHGMLTLKALEHPHTVDGQYLVPALRQVGYLPQK